MNVVCHSVTRRAVGCALFAAALALPTVTKAQNSIYSIAASSVPATPAGAALSMRLVNGTGGAYADNQIYWLIIGQDPNNNNAWSYIDGNGGIHPITAALNNAAGHLTKNGANYANIDFPLVSGKWIGIPRITAARMYYSVGEPVYITTYDNGFAGPDINNPADPNRNVTFDWSEFTIDSGGYHGNTTRVDMFGFPIQMRVINSSGNFDQTTGELESQTRSGIFSEYAAFVPSEFQSLATVQAPYRIVAPLHGSFAAGQPNANYFAPYTTQYTTQDIMAASGPLANNSPVDASINRHVWTLPQSQWSVVTNYYKAAPANYYAAFWHTIAINGLAYGMPYDDYNNQSSYVTIGDPKGLIFRIAWNTPVSNGYAGTPYSGTPAAVPGSVYASNYDKGGQGVAYSVSSVNGSANSYRTDGVDLETSTDSSSNGYNLGWTAAGQWFKYTINAATTGKYTVNFRVASQSGGGTFHLLDENGNNLTGIVTAPSTGGWQTWTTVAGSATLSAGKHVIQVVQDSAGFNLSAMQWVAPTNTYTGTPYSGAPAAIPGAINFVNYDKGGQGVAVNFTSTNGSANGYRTDGNDIEACSDSSGNGYNIGWTTAGQWTKYTVNVTTTKTYIVGFRVAAPSAGGTFHLADENGTNLTGTVTVPATGGWQNWTTITANANLTAGQHVLQLVQDGTGYNLNWMAF